MTNIAIIYYSTYHHVAKLAEHIKEGVERVEGVTATIYQVAETLPDDVLVMMHAPPKKDYPIATPQTIKEADGVLFGLATRFGSIPTQMKTLWDSCAELFSKRELLGMPGGFFFATGAPGAGQESTAYSALPFLAINGMIYVSLGFRDEHIQEDVYMHGGSVWGAGTIAGAGGAREPTEGEISMAKTQGENFAEVTKKLTA